MIRSLGGKTGSDWLADKESLPFVFPAMCWEQSHIPYDVWMARTHSTNTVEAVHQDINREGIHCTLVGATRKAMRFDKMKLASLKIFEDQGVRETYDSKHTFENALKNVKRKTRSRGKNLKVADDKISSHNR
ncbi:hypothetical protein PQX77_019278 [Marasmius sp. AFHP31]|nr:hypothetical protein PQX77_019278 [Marasmius sp. AFHP31]